jgi:hypothetical protein
MAPEQRHLLCKAGSRELLKAVVVVVKTLFHCDEHQGDDREDDLESLHAELAWARRLLAPLRCRAAPQPADLSNNSKIYQRADERNDDHGNADGICVKAIYHGAGADAQYEGAEADGKAQTVRGSKEGADALQEREEKT